MTFRLQSADVSCCLEKILDRNRRDGAGSRTSSHQIRRLIAPNHSERLPLVFEEMRRCEEFAPARPRLVDCDLLYDPARARRHHEDSIPGVDGFMDVMRDENHGPAELLMDFQ